MTFLRVYLCHLVVRWRGSFVKKIAKTITTVILFHSGNMTSSEHYKGKVSVFIERLYCSTSHSLRHGWHSFTCKLHRTCLYLVSVRPMAPPRLRLRTSNCSLLLIYLPRQDERLSRFGWLTYSGRFTHINGHPSAAGRAQDRESSPVKDQRSTAVPRNQPMETDLGRL